MIYMLYLLENLSGFIEFEDKYDAEDAIKDLDDTKLCGERVKLELSKVLNTQIYPRKLFPGWHFFNFRVAKTNIAISAHLVAFDIEVSVAKCLPQEVVTDHAHPEVAIVVVIDLAVDHVVVVTVADEVVDVTM